MIEEEWLDRPMQGMEDPISRLWYAGRMLDFSVAHWYADKVLCFKSLEACHMK